MTFSRSTSRIVMVIVPVAFIAGAPKGADDQPTGQNTTFLFCKIFFVIPGFRCPPASHLKMSGFKVGFAASVSSL
ncbi:hypothetical protein [Burkholderia sp. Nafp2/4-1b]|uniref:hypothetical protein n=1 Tax=Burkholderia sp. Nafp2/4-1b TaxID=2116686 RepID=UPI0013CEE877|nr:hypothetical protein [Burkholderia sp. Nafp2/4-1b]